MSIYEEHTAHSLAKKDRDEFIKENHVAILSVNHPDPNRAPIAAPVWYAIQPDGGFWIISASNAIKTKAIQAAGAFTLSVHRDVPNRFVGVSGPVVETRPATEADIRLHANRYLDAKDVEEYVSIALKERGDQFVFVIEPKYWSGH